MRADRLRELAAGEGFDALGVLPAEPSEHVEFLDRWLERDFHGSMAYLARADARAARAYPARLASGVRSVVIVADGYDQEDPPGIPDDPSRGVIARYARGRDYHKVVLGRLRRVHRQIEAEVGGPVPGRVYVDTGPLLERELAWKAGMGWFGRNTMLIHPRRGSFFFLGVLLLDLAVESDRAPIGDHCGSCRACLDECPTDALLGRDENGAPVMDARRCISYLTIENRGPIPTELRPAIGNRVYGCDICQEVCPFNRFSRVAGEDGYAARGPGEAPAGVEAHGPIEPSERDGARSALHPGTDGPPLVELMATALDPAAWDAFTRGSAIRRAGREGLARNVAVALGNWLAEVEGVPLGAVAALAVALDDPSALVRAHAAWALGRTEDPAAARALAQRGTIERDRGVSAEIDAALLRDGAAR